MAARKRSKPRRSPTVSVYDFLDYRAFLKAHYDSKKKTSRNFSHRMFSKLAGFRSPNHLKLIMDGQRNLGLDSIPRVAAAVGLEGREVEFFADLVSFDQALNLLEKNRALQAIASSRRFRAARRIDGDLLVYLTHWYNAAIRELAAHPDFSEDPQWIAARLRPRITPTEAAQAMELLLSLGLLARDPDTGRVERGEPTLTTEHEVRSIGAAAFHHQMILRAAESIDTVSSMFRDLAALTVCVRPEVAAQVRESIHRFREQITELCDADARGDVVYQLNIQWFPLSDPHGSSLDEGARSAGMPAERAR
jgi:uncharacterized protein (TIGR02147 family)